MTATAARRAAAAATFAAICTAYGNPAASAADAPDQLKPFQASYSWTWHGATVAVSTLKLEQLDGNNWVYSSSSEPRGLGHLYPMRPVLRSSLRITDQGVQPLSFKADGSGDSHNANVMFDWSSGRATGVYEGTAIDMPIKPGIQDDLSVQIAMMLELLHGRTPDQLSMISKNSSREYRYRREGTESLVTPLGQVDTVIYSSQHPGSPRVTRFWCAPTMGYLPMRVEQKRLDKVEWSMEIRSVTRD
jgi:Protein of unknown function (DUF3108)